MCVSTVVIFCRYGGAFYSSAGPYISFTSCLFENNSATNNGGAIQPSASALDDNTWAQGECVAVANCTFRNNSAINVNGGAVYYLGSLGESSEELFISNSTFFGNNASSGGAVVPWGVARVEIAEVLFEHNTAYYGRGGALYAYGEFIYPFNYESIQKCCIFASFLD